MKLLLIAGVVVALLGGGGAAWYFFLREQAPVAASSDHAPMAPSTEPVYVTLGRFQVPVFDGGALIGQIVLEAQLLVPDLATKAEVEKKLVPARNAVLADLYDVAQLVVLRGQAIALGQLKQRLTTTTARVLGPTPGIEFLIQAYSYVPA